MSEVQKSLDKMTVKELREVAKEIPGLTGISSLKKDELLAKISEAKGSTGVAEVKKETASKKINTGKATVIKSAKDAKVKIIELRELKKVAHNNNDNRTASILRRKMNILKKKSRKISKNL